MSGITYRQRAASAALAAILALTGAPAALAAEESPESSYAQDYARLQDGVLEYDELEGRIRNFYGPIKEAYAMVDNTFYDQAEIASLMREAASDMEDDADELKDAMKDGSIPGSGMADAMTQMVTDQLTAKAYRSGAQTMYRTIDRMLRDDSSTMKSMQRTVNQILYGAQSAMNGYRQLEANLAVAQKGVALAETARQLQQAMEAQGMAVDGDVLSASASLASARSQLAALQTQTDSVKKSLCQLTGYSEGNLPEIGAVPAADPAAVAAIDLEGDLERAVNNNYELITLRSGSGGSMDSLQQTLTKSTTRKRNKLQEVAYSEDTVRSTTKALYDTVQEKKAAWDAAGTAYQSASLTWQAAGLQKQSGALSQIQYDQQELAWLQAQAAFQCADLALQQALQDYQWMVKGLTVSVSE